MGKAEYMTPDMHDALWAEYGDAQAAKLRGEADRKVELQRETAQERTERAQLLRTDPAWEQHRARQLETMVELPDVQLAQALIAAACEHYETSEFVLLQKGKRREVRKDYNVKHFIGSLIEEFTELNQRQVSMMIDSKTWNKRSHPDFPRMMFREDDAQWDLPFRTKDSSNYRELLRADLAGILDCLDRDHQLEVTFTPPERLSARQQLAIEDRHRALHLKRLTAEIDERRRAQREAQREAEAAATMEPCEPPSSTRPRRRPRWWPGRRSARD